MPSTHAPSLVRKPSLAHFTPNPLVYPCSLASVVEYYSTIMPLVGGKTVTAESVARSIYGVVKDYRARLLELQPTGLLPLKKPTDLFYLQNCRPPVMPFKPATRFCNRAKFCPFCHARQAGEAFRKIDRVCFPQAQMSPDAMDYVKPPSDLVCERYDLVERVVTPPLLYAPDVNRPYLLTLDQVLDSRKRRNGWVVRRKLIDNMHAEGMIEFIAIGGHDRFRRPQLQLRQLLLVPPGYFQHVDPEHPVNKADFVRYQRITRYELARLVARVLRYPKYLLHGKDMQQVAAVWAARHRVHCLATLGCLRSS